MPLDVGTKIGRYEILSLIGSGGMGEVYLAEDPRLGRQVAIKLLTESAASDHDSRRRFGQEARSASSLNHPNIVTIHEIGEWEGKDFIAMELVRGESVRDLLAANGRVRLHEALNIAIQVASALDAAHAAGIVHRDIKPENIIRRPDGLVKVLDFGLAKQTSTVSDSFNVDSEAPTYSPAETLPGMVMGTIPYMSPEQARGKPVDARTDVWSLGVVLYEMMAGRTPFSGETRSDLLVSILTAEPDPLPVRTPGSSREPDTVVRKALAKDRDKRYPTASEMQLDLKILLSELNSGAFQTEVLTRTTAGEPAAEVLKTVRTTLTRPRLGLLQLLVITVLILTAGGAALWYYGRSARNRDVGLIGAIKTSQLATWKSIIGDTEAIRPRFSPDRKFIAFASFKDGHSAIWLKQLDGGEAFTRQPDDESYTSPVWSPDGERLAFYSNRGGRRGIWSMLAFGGQPELKGEVPSRATLVRWSSNGSTIYYELNQNLYALDTTSGVSTRLTSFPEDVIVNRQFAVSRDEKRIAYVDRTKGQSDLWVSDIAAWAPTQLTRDPFLDGTPVWHPDGNRIIYTSERDDIKQIVVAYLDGSDPLQLTNADGDLEVADVSADGSQILYTSSKDDSDIWSVNIETGRESQLTSDMGVEFWPDLSPDGAKVVYQDVSRTSLGTKLFSGQVLLQGLSDEAERAVLSPDGFHPRWSPEGKRIAFLRSDAGVISLWATSADGGDARQITQGGVVFSGATLLPYNRVQVRDFDWSSDGQSLVYAAVRDGIANLWRVDANGGPETLLTHYGEKGNFFMAPSISPDGSKIAWVWMKFSHAGGANNAEYSVWILENGSTRQVHGSQFPVRLLGWNAAGTGLILQSVPTGTENPTLPSDISIFEVDLGPGTRQPVRLADLQAVYPHNIVLSPDRRSLALAAAGETGDEIRTLPLKGGPSKKVTSSNDPRVYFSNLSYSSDGRNILFGKQANWKVISAITNFKQE